MPEHLLLHRMALSIDCYSDDLNSFLRDEFMVNRCISRHLALAMVHSKNIWLVDSILMAHLGQIPSLTFHLRARLWLKKPWCIIHHAYILVAFRVQPRHKVFQCLIQAALSLVNSQRLFNFRFSLLGVVMRFTHVWLDWHHSFLSLCSPDQLQPGLLLSSLSVGLPIVLRAWLRVQNSIILAPLVLLFMMITSSYMFPPFIWPWAQIFGVLQFSIR